MYFSLWCHTLFALSNPSVGHPWNDLSPQEYACLKHDTCPNYEVPIFQNNLDTGLAPMWFVILSVSVLSASFLQSIGIVAAYTTFVFAIGRVLRFAVSGGAFRTTLEDCQEPKYLVSLVELMYIARAQEEFDLERKVYVRLMDTLRQTEVLERKTRPKEKED